MNNLDLTGLNSLNFGCFLSKVPRDDFVVNWCNTSKSKMNWRDTVLVFDLEIVVGMI